MSDEKKKKPPAQIRNRKRSNSRHIPTDETRELAQWLPAVGATWEDIAEILGISKDCLHKYYKRELSLGLKNVLARIGSRIAHDALYGEAKEWRSSAFFIMKTKGQWRETHRQEITGADGKDLKPTVTIAVDAPKQETFEEFEARRKKQIEHRDSNGVEPPTGTTD